MARKSKENPLGLDPVEGEVVSELGVNLLGYNKPINDALEVDSIIMEMFRGLQAGDTIWVALELVKKSPNFVRAQKHDGWKRVDQVNVNGFAPLDAEAAELINDVRIRVQEAIDAAAGQGTMVKRRDGEDVAATDDARPEGSEG